MKVYVVLESEYRYCGVYGSYEQAEDGIAEIIKVHPVKEGHLNIKEEEITIN